MKVVIDIPENDYKLACNYPDALIACYAHYIKAGVPLHKKHGRLIDADALCEDLLKRWSVAETRKEELIKAVMADVVTPIIACQPTIVEAEDET